MSETEKIPYKNRLSRSIVTWIFRVLYRTLCKLEFTGWENVPKEGPYLMVFNHVSIYDPPLVMSFWPVKPEVIGAGYLWDRPGFGIIVRMYGGLPITDDYFDRKVLKQALEVLNAKRVLVIAPEGKRSMKPGLLPAQPGVVYLAEKAGVPILPIGVTGTTSDLLTRALKLKRPHLKVQIGKPFQLSKSISTGKERKRARQRNADLVMGKIAELLPPEYQGVYANPTG
ncbi:MAG: 1-acyl-sn-glycerol-3-phosphate acyltransferase [Chloroflexi bacterium]|nr:1-acyl-sn-glycerol-3-phosphate acyltransferase [Chloroflexota bacterium]